MAGPKSSVQLTLENVPQICDVVKTAGFLASDWEGLASQLRINDRGRIKVMHPQHPALCLEETIRQWLHQDTEASWEKFATAVSKVLGYGEATKQKVVDAVSPEVNTSSIRAAFKEEVQASLASLREAHSRAVDKVEIAKTEITNQEPEIADTIKESFVHLKAILKERRQSLLKQAKEMAQKKRDTLSEQRESLRLAQATVESQVGFTESASDEEFVSMKQQLSSMVQQLTEKYKQIELNPAEVANVSVVLPSAENLREFCQNQSEVYISILDPSKCTVQGLEKANETNSETKLTVHAVDKRGRTCPYFPESIITAELKTVTSGSLTPVQVERKDPSSFELSYTPTTRGRHQLSVRVGNVEIGPIQVFVHHPPTQLGTPVRVIKGVKTPWGVAFGSQGELCVTKCDQHQLAILDRSGQRVKTIGSEGEAPFGQSVTGITTDHEGNIYVASYHKVQKFNKEGKLLKTIGSDRVGTGRGLFHCPGGVRCHNNQLYVCDRDNARIHVFDFNLNFVRSFGSKGDAPGQLKRPWDIDFDSRGNAYITDNTKHQIHMFTESGMHQFGRKGQGKGELMDPAGVSVFNDHVYVSEKGNHRVSVFRIYKAEDSEELKFVHCVSFGRGIRKFNDPHGIAVDQDGFVYVCDFGNDYIQVF